MRDLGNGIYCLDANYVAESVASIYLLVENQKACVIETGSSHSVPSIKQGLEAIGLGFDDVEYVIATHIHLDHAGGAGTLMQLCPNAKFIVHPRGAWHMINPEKLQAGTKAVYGEEKFAKLYGELIPIEEERVISADDEYRLDFHGRELLFLDTPGHAMHHFCIYDAKSEGIFTGDTFGVAYPQLSSSNGETFIFATTTPVHFDPDAMLSSIDRLMTLNPKKMYLTHFCAIEPTESVITRLKASLNAFVTLAKELPATEDRVDRIEDGILDWLLAGLAENDCGLSIEEKKRVLAMDAKLNAQGIEVWLQRYL
ncbi:MAG: Beta-lactamase related protein [uncultured Thiotrichaceae bacterium]|uniref:Beta-lactamase related protein n=1 Tax=uncultured Thiotrichaceae bacterium TaxID=298394 RepID=A0A6S6SSM4_9GAMM|nr:MAG: Beta-lactamase related protein [uncultured Thiotrichaceae bacterium]